MLRNLLKVASRNLWKHKGYSLINVAGLSFGLAASFLILLWVQDELRSDRHLEDGERIHAVWRTVHVGNATYTWHATSKPLRDVLRSEYPDIQEAVHSFGTRLVIKVGDRSFREDGSYASAEFFEVFDLPFVAGSAGSALQDESSAVIADRMARKLFGEQWNETARRSARLSRSTSARTSPSAAPSRILHATVPFQADLILPSHDYLDRNPWVETWGNNAFPLYVKLREGASRQAVTGQIADVVMKNEEGADETLFLKPYEDIYLYSDYVDGYWSAAASSTCAPLPWSGSFCFLSPRSIS